MKVVSKDRVKSATIEFDEDELDFLAVVMSKISGDPERSPRKHQEKFSKILEQLGYTYYKCRSYKFIKSHSGIEFKHYEN